MIPARLAGAVGRGRVGEGEGADMRAIPVSGGTATRAASARAEADAEAKRAALGSVGRVRREGKGGSGPVWRSRASGPCGA